MGGHWITLLNRKTLTLPVTVYVNGQWSMVNGLWSMVNGQWSMVNGQWSMVNGQWSMVNGQCSLLTIPSQTLPFNDDRSMAMAMTMDQCQGS